MCPEEYRDRPWSNWNDEQTVTPWQHCYASSLQDLVTIVQQAEAEGGKCVRAVGSGWSLSDIALTTDYLVETSRLGKVLTTVLQANPSPLNNSARGLHLVHVEAGIMVRDLCTHLDNSQPPLALHTMGGSDGQTLAGILSTGVHGPDFDRGPVADTVRAVHLVGPGGVQYWIEPTQGITNQSALQQALGSSVNIVYDDDLFNAVIVSVGTLGVIYSVILEVDPQYDLVQERKSMAWPDVRHLLASGDAFTTQVDHTLPNRCVQVVIDPGPGHACHLVTRAEAAPTGPPSGGGGFGAGSMALVEALISNNVVALLGAVFRVLGQTLTSGNVREALQGLERQRPGSLGDVLGAALDGDARLTAQIVTLATQLNQPEGMARGWAHIIMSGPDPLAWTARGYGVELAFDATNGSHLSFLDEALPLLDGWYQRENLALGGWFSLRFVGRSKALLGPEHQSERTCRIEIVGLRKLHSTLPVIERLEALGRLHGAIQHWGMSRNLTALDVARAYPSLDKWRQARWRLTTQGAHRTFDSTFSIRTGLSQPPASSSWHWSHQGMPGASIVGPGKLEGTVGVVTVMDSPRSSQRPYVFVWGDKLLRCNWWDGAHWHWSEQGCPPRLEVRGGVGATTVMDSPSASQRPYAFVHCSDGHLWVNWWDGANWHWDDQGPPFPGGSVAAGVGVVTVMDAPTAPQRPHAFVKGSDGHLWVNSWDAANRRWRWDDHGVPEGGTSIVVAGVGVVTVMDSPTAPQRPHAFVKGSDNNLWVNWWDAAQQTWRWGGLGQPVGVPIRSGVGAITVMDSPTGPQRPYVFLEGGDGNLWLRWWDAAQQTWQWDNRGSPAAQIKGAVGTVSVKDSPTSGQRPYAFVLDGSGNLCANWWDGSNWQWSNQGAPAGSAVGIGIGAVAVMDTPTSAQRPFAFMGSTGTRTEFPWLVGQDHLWINWWA